MRRPVTLPKVPVAACLEEPKPREDARYWTGIWHYARGLARAHRGELEQAQADDTDILMIDTAGRLQNKADLMAELEKIVRVIKKKDETAPHAVLLVLDATTGQNALSQAKLFDEAITLDALALTKLDGTAKGGIVANICHELKIPVRFIGIGEQADDLRDFTPDEFVDALFSRDESGNADPAS